MRAVRFFSISSIIGGGSRRNRVVVVLLLIVVVGVVGRRKRMDPSWAYGLCKEAELLRVFQAVLVWVTGVPDQCVPEPLLVTIC